MSSFNTESIDRMILSMRNERHAAAVKAGLGTSLEVAGLQRPQLIEILTRIQTQLPDLDEEFDWLNILQDLWESRYFEARLISLQLLFGTPQIVGPHLWGMLDHWTGKADNWILADWISHVRAIALHKSPNHVVRMAAWLQNPSPWRRRSAIVSLMYLSPKTLELEPLLGLHELLAFIEPAFEDDSAAVQQAILWTFRVLKEQQHPGFTAYWAENRGRLPAYIVNHLRSAASSPQSADTGVRP